MRTRSRRRLGWAAAGVLAAAAGAPSLAHAQQSGLFPLAPIRRERVPCPMEDPVYKLYRHEYFGYHPTCWRRFPANWGCPSPEAPNAAAEFKKLPRDVPPDEEGEGMPGPEGEKAPAPGPGNPPPGEPNPNNIPALPEGRNPFEFDNNTPAKPNLRDPNRNPFLSEDPAKPPAGGAQPTKPPAGDNTPVPPPVDAPGVDNPGAADASSPGLPPVAEAVESAPGAIGGGPEQPLLSLPDPTAGAPAGAGIPGPGTTIAPPPAPRGVMADPNTTGPFQAPRRTSVISNLFSGRLFRR